MFRASRNRWIGVGLVLVIFTACTKPNSEITDLNQAPDFQADVLYPLGQPHFDLSKVKKTKPVLLVFWATWCPTCKEELPALNQLVSQYSEKMAIVSINAQENAAAVEAFLGQNQVHFPILLDESGEIANRFEVTAIPSVLLLAKGGKILYYGFQLPDKEKLEAALTD